VFFLAFFAARFSAIDFAGFFFVSFRWSWPLPMGSLLYGVTVAFFLDAGGMVTNPSKKVQRFLRTYHRSVIVPPEL
jgi:hypothetical protein